MSLNLTLVSSVKAHNETASLGPAFSEELKAQLKDAVDQFTLAPDQFIDVGRLPATVVDLPTLVQYLKTVQDRLANRPNDVKNSDWDVAKTGALRLYKLYVCCIHALHSYVSQGTPPNYNVSPADFASGAIAHGRGQIPQGMSTDGSKMWAKTFEGGQPRTFAVMSSLIYLCTETTVGPVTTSKPSPTNSPSKATPPPQKGQTLEADPFGGPDLKDTDDE
jgi:hypothetical protein